MKEGKGLRSEGKKREGRKDEEREGKGECKFVNG